MSAKRGTGHATGSYTSSTKCSSHRSPCLKHQENTTRGGCMSKRERKLRSMAKQCRHLNQIREVTPSANGCEDCLRIGDTWVHLRICLICGHVGCCDDSKNKHATKHFHATNHPIIQSFEPGENWGWCYIDQLELDARHWRVEGRSAHT